MKKYKKYFKYMGVFWSCSAETLEAIQLYVEEHGCVPDLSQYEDVRQLKSHIDWGWVRIEPDKRRKS